MYKRIVIDNYYQDYFPREDGLVNIVMGILTETEPKIPEIIFTVTCEYANKNQEMFTNSKMFKKELSY